MANFIHMKLLLRGLLCFLLFLCSCDETKIGDQTQGKVINVIDGDTFDLLTSVNDTIRIRIYGIDAPERSMPFYNVSKKYLNDLCYNKYVTVVVKDIDQYNRIVGSVFSKDDEDLGLAMVKAGLAWHYKYFSNDDKDLALAEEEARKSSRGLWIDKNPVAPWEYRQQSKKDQ